MESYSDSELRNAIAKFCNHSTFKSYVKNIVYDQYFWDKLFEDNRIKNIVDQRIRSKLPHETRKQLRKMLPELIITKIIEQIPSVLNQNVQMTKALEEHIEFVKVIMQESVRQELDKIVNEDQYHKINNAYFNAITCKSNKVMQDIKIDYHNQKNKLKEKLDKVDNIENKLQKMNKSFDNLKKINITLIILFATYGLFTFYKLNSKL